MHIDNVLLLGYFAQLMFTGRFFVQWLASEKKKESTVPVSFWYMSIAGGGLLLLYSFIQKDPVYMIGLSMNLFIYIRNMIYLRKENLNFKSVAASVEYVFWYVFLLFSTAILAYTISSLVYNIFAGNHVFETNNNYLHLILGLIGQILFTARFVVQWIVTEYKKQSTMPIAFWYLSTIGGLLLLVYAILRVDPVFIVGQSTGTFVYLRNIFFINKKNAKKTKEVN